MRKAVVLAASLAALVPTAANAAFVVTYPTSQPVPTPPGPPAANNFFQGLALAGITRFVSTGATLALTSGGNITFEFFGNEALLRNVFRAGGASYTNTNAYTNNFGVGPGATNTPLNLGTYNFTPLNFDPRFFTNGAGPAITPGSQFFGIGLPDGKAATNGSFITNTLWLMFDDNTGNPDDNHDDLIIRATFAVPEPSTWAMFLLGFGVIGFVMRRRPNVRVSFV